MEVSSFVDNTAFFRARIKAIRLRQTASSRQRLKSGSELQGDEVTLEPSRSPTPTETGQEEFLSVSPNFHLYAAYARQICQHIRELADLVLERRKSYLLTSVNVYGHSDFMTDEDRQQFDSDTDLAMKQCSRLVRNLDFQLDNDKTLRTDDEFPHMKAITLLLNVYLKDVCKIVTELRAVHLKKRQHLNKICRLGNLVSMCGKKIDVQRIEEQKLKDNSRNGTATQMDKTALSTDNKNIGGLKSERLENQQRKEPDNSSFATAEDQYDEDAGQVQEIDFSAGEQVQLTAENQHLLERFIQRNSEIEQIETQFAELQKLQQTFIEKVVEQEKDIEIIHEKTIHTLDNLDQANEFIREAIKNSASRRVIALFCLIVLTFTLLFLDWYNP